MTYWCEHCNMLLKEDQVNYRMIDESFDYDYGHIHATNVMIDKVAVCPDCKREVEEHE